MANGYVTSPGGGNLADYGYVDMGYSYTTNTYRDTSSAATVSTVSYNTDKNVDVISHRATDSPTSLSAATFGPLTVNYTGKSLIVKLLDLNASTEGYNSDHEDAAAFNDSIGINNATPTATGGGTSNKKGGTYSNNAVGEEVFAASTLMVTYAVGFSSPKNANKVYTPPVVTIDLTPNTADYIVPNSVRFTWMGHLFEDFDGVLVRDRSSTFNGYVAGQVDYAAGIAKVTDYVVEPGTVSTNFVLNSLWTVRQSWNTASIFMRTKAAPMKPSGFVMNLSDTAGNDITATGDLNGNLIGPHLKGKMDYETGLVELQFGDLVLDSSLTDAQKAEWWYSANDVGKVELNKIWRPWPVDPTTLRYNSVTYFYLPLDADILGIDPVRLPSDGRVPIYRAGGFVVVGNSKSITAVVTNGQTINCARVRLSRIQIKGNNGVVINTGYTENLEAGTVSINDTTGWNQPVTIEHRIEDTAVVADVQITGQLRVTRSISHDYTVGDSYVSSVLVAGDRKARVSLLFDQASWTNNLWSDVVVGDGAIGQYNDVQYPIQVKNDGALTERWILRFKNTTVVQVIGEHVGVLGDFPIVNNIAPLNPATATPYFTVLALGFGGGWLPGEIIRFNTVGTPYPFEVVRTVQQGAETVLDDSVQLIARGDVDRP